MVSFRNILFLVTAAVATVSEARSIGHKRYGRLQARHAYHNETIPHPVEGYPAEGYPSTGETGIEGYPAETISVPHGTGIETVPTLAPVPQYGDESDSPITTCYTYYETKTVSYTLGNGHAVTTTFVQTNIVTETISPALETPVGQGISTTVQEGPVVTVVPVPVGGDNDYNNGNETPEEPEYEWTSTSTTTVLHTVTRILPIPNEAVTDSPAGETPCVVATVTVTAPAQETVTVKETVKEYITVTATADAGPIETVSPIVEEPVEEPVDTPTPGYGEEEPVEGSPVEESPVEEFPVEEYPVEESPVEHTPVPVHPPYGNYTGNYTFPTTTQEPQATLTVVPIPAY